MAQHQRMGRPDGHRSQWIVTPRPSRGAPITFGVEIEAVLAFTEPRLQAVLDNYYSRSHIITKTFPDRVHDCLLIENDWTHQCRNLYPSWAISASPYADISLQFVGRRSTSVSGSEKVRPYLAEPLIIVKEAIENVGIPVDIKAQLRREVTETALGQVEPCKSIILQAHSADYSRWTVTSDHTLIGCLESQLHQAIGDQVFKTTRITDPDGIIRTIRQKHWDSSGIELISPIFTYTDKAAAFKSMNRCLDSLSQNSVHKTISSTSAALQVHIGLDIEKPQDIPLSTIQHLAYILICHEDLLSKLHPRSRCGLPLKPINTSLEDSMTEDWDNFEPDQPFSEKSPAEIAAEDEQYLRENDERVLAAEARYTGYGTTNSNARYFCYTTSSAYPPTPTHVASHIFDSQSNLLDLVALLQRTCPKSEDADKGHRYRGYMYNFDNLVTVYSEDKIAWKKGKPTIEFRQHACSTDSEEIKHWVELCFTLVKFAQSMADVKGSNICAEIGPGWQREAGKYATKGEWPCQNIESLLGENFVRLEDEDIVYWKGRYERYKNDRPSIEEIDQNVI